VTERISGAAIPFFVPDFGFFVPDFGFFGPFFSSASFALFTIGPFIAWGALNDMFPFGKS
jgi:hypothetical protein